MKEALTRFISRFDRFHPREIQAIVDHTDVLSFKKGTVILREGEVCNRCFFVLSGCVRQYQLVWGEEKTTAFFTEEQAAVMYASYMNQEPSKYYLACVEDSTLTAGTREQEEKLHAEYPNLAFLIHSLMPQDYSRMQERLSLMLNHPPEERYLILMKERPGLVNRVPLHQLASYIGVTPESFSRIRKRIANRQGTGH